MNRKNFSLKDIQLLSDHYSQAGSPEPVALFQFIQGFYPSGKTPDSVRPVPFETLIEKIKTSGNFPSFPEQTDDSKPWLNSLREKLNSELLALMSERGNPSSLSLDSDFTFIQFEGTTELGPTTQHRKFKESEITFNLPDELKAEFENQLQRLKDKEELANQQMKEILEKEKVLEESKVAMEKETSQFRAQIKKLREEEQTHIDQANDQSQKETSRIRKELEEVQEELDSLRKERNQNLTDHESNRTRLDTDFSRRDQIFRVKFDEMTELMEKLAAEEKGISSYKEKAYKSAKAKQDQIKKVSAQQAKKNQQLLRLSKSLESEKKTFKTRLQEDYKTKREELEFEEDEERLGRENEKLRIREQGLALDAQKKADEQTKKRFAELEKLEKEYSKKQKLLNKQEKENDLEKALLLKEMRGIEGGKFAIDQMKTAAKTQEDLLKRKRKLLKAMEEDRPKVEGEIKEKLVELEKEFEGEHKKLAEQNETLLKNQKRLREKEEALVERETNELGLINQEFEEFKNSLEVGQIEKEMVLDKREEKIESEEQKVLELQQKQMAEEKANQLKNEETEAEVMAELQEIQLIKSDVVQHQVEVKKFLDEFQTTYDKILQAQGSEYEDFKKRIVTMEEEATRLTSSLKEKEKLVLEESAASEKVLHERLKQRESMVDVMEKDLRGRVEEYQTFVKELADVKNSMNEEDQSRKAELLESLSHYEDKLSHLGKAFEDLSEAFQVEKEKGQIEIVPDEDEKKPLEYDDALAKAEWPLAIRQRLGSATASEQNANITEYLYKFSEKWGEWIKVPDGKFLMGHPRQKDSAPHREIAIEKPFLINKYPVTNVEFYKFINETQYKTEAETLIDAIVYHNGNLTLHGNTGPASFSNPSLTPDKNAFWLCPDGQPDSLYGKHNHPVTQVTWNDAKAFCKWKSETTGQTIRLPSEKEWEYVASNFGQIGDNQFFWDEDRVVEFCNIEETGICGTLSVDHFPENEHCGGVAGLYGNVFEWVEDTKNLPENGRNSASNGLTYKIARGGSFITHFKHIAPWRRISFIKSYCTSFLGFRTVCEDV
jgi:formylglycine-generating enzyme